MKITRQSPFTGEINSMDLDITHDQILQYEKGELIQNVFSHLSPSEREFFKTGITPEEWDKYIG